MKKLVKSIVIVAVMLSFTTVVFANSGPVFWQGYPSSEVMSIQENCPIKVESENLVFDFSDCEDDAHTISGKVTATYEMLNPTDELRQVHMAFPFIGTIDGLFPNNVTITADDSVIPYDIYIGDVVDSHGSPFQKDKEVSFDFADVVSTITDEPYMAENFREDEKGKLYVIDVKPTTGQRINFAVDFDFNYEKTKVITNGFNRYERDEEKTRIAAWCYEPEVLEIFVLGEDINLNINAYSDSELKEKTDLLTYRVSEHEMQFKSYLMEFIRKNTRVKSESTVSDTQLYNLYAKSLDINIARNMGCASEHDIMSQENYKRILTLVYTVDFPPNSQREVSISYKTSGTMDMTETKDPLYSFDYILNPAENWADFKNLNIKITTPKEAPYIVKSSITMTKEENHIYTAYLAELPEDDLSFTLYAKEKITLWDKLMGKLHYRFRYFTPFVVGTAALLIGLITGLAVWKIKHNKQLAT
jgi:hypothetical protein